ncbi:MAG: leucyl aminopeptidase [Actinomycetota bacterium]
MPKFEQSRASVRDIAVDLLVLPVFEGPEAGPGVRDAGRAIGVDLVRTLKDAKSTGKRGESMIVPTLGKLPAAFVMLLGLGEKKKVDADALRRAIGKAASRVCGYRKVATTLSQAAKGPDDSVRATVEGLLLGAYKFDRYKSKDSKPVALKEFTLIEGPRTNARRTARAVEESEILCEAVAWARDLINTPAGDATPEILAREAQKMAKAAGLRSKVWTKQELRRGGFGGILGVGQGSEHPPRLIELSYRGAAASRAPIALAGKGITFDSGGLSLKDAKNMEWMKADKAGAAAMMAVMRAIGMLRPKVNVIAAIPCAENMPSGSAVRPGDVLRHRGGKTSEVLNTDAEGRLVLADALAKLAERKPAAIIDAATLTGACMVALGDGLYGVLGNDKRLVRDILDAGEAEGEPGWELPLWDGYRSQIDSSIADVKNTGSRYGGAISAALFLREFVGDTPWVHLDVAGTAYAESPGDYWPKGGTGSPVRTVVRYILGKSARR